LLPSRPAGSSSTPLTPHGFATQRSAAGAFFESTPRVLAERPGADPEFFTQTGFTLAVLEAGKPSGMYHAESTQEDFLVLAGTCLLLIEEHERLLRAWDFVHCPPGTRHTFVGTGDAPCVIFMTGARRDNDTIVYPRSETALARGVGVENETPSPAEAYAEFPDWQVGRPRTWPGLPWT
jgi:uncharacterized cupin superfamily protein